MSLTLDARELALLREAIAALASPLEVGDVNEWRGEVNRVVGDLFEADQAVFFLSGCDAEPCYSAQHDEASWASYLEYYQHIDEGARRARAAGVDVFCRRQLYEGDLSTLLDSEHYNDFLSPGGVEDSLGIVADFDSAGPTVLGLHSRRYGTPNFGARGMEIAGLLNPVLRAGAAMCRRFHGARTRLGTLLDGMDDAAALMGPDGRMVHMNAPVRSLLEGSPVRGAIESRMRSAARAAAELAPPGREGDAASIHQRFTRAGRLYEIQSTRVGEPLGLPGVAMVVVRESAAPPTTTDLRARFGVTKRQAEVAVLLWRGRTNQEIAEELFISPHTARHHTEAVLAGLGIHSRNEVREAVVEESA